MKRGERSEPSASGPSTLRSSRSQTTKNALGMIPEKRHHGHSSDEKGGPISSKRPRVNETVSENHAGPNDSDEEMKDPKLPPAHDDDVSINVGEDQTLLDNRASLPTTPNKNPSAKLNSGDKGKEKAVNESGATPIGSVAELAYKFKPGVHEELPPISDIQEIFDDLTSKAHQLGLGKGLDHLKNKELKVATMCSGTESPLLALEMIRDTLKRVFGRSLHFQHLFSAEIVPYKQAYIQRNFRPPFIFRDIRQLALNEKADTAYGGRSTIPTLVDLLVVGFSCVDFSALNPKAKSITDTGESGDTFRAVLAYAKQHRPRVIIVENIVSAPWPLIRAIFRNDQEGINDAAPKNGKPFDNIWDADDPAYAAEWVKVDTKQYYLPQTRQRCYMICIDKTIESAEDMAQQWKVMMHNLERPASVSVEAFLLDEEDPRLHRAREELSRTALGEIKVRKVVDWIRCQARHQQYRAAERLGTRRSITKWVDNGSCTAQDYWWRDWVLAQVERLWDTFEAAYLRNIVRGFDPFHKVRVWELSQNIDRFTDTTPFGCANCITPTGQPFLTTRGGPIIGMEVLALQGLPINRLSLTRETQKEQQDLAGNAMSSTVVGAALLGVLTAAYRSFCLEDQKPKAHAYDSLMTIQKMDLSHLRGERLLDFAAIGDHTVNKLCHLAGDSIRLCYCEGQTQIATNPILKCHDCGHQACGRCAGLPAHSYNRSHQIFPQQRTDPREFREAIKRAIPMRLQISGLQPIDFELFKEAAPFWSVQEYDLLMAVIGSITRDEFRFQEAKRSHCWTVSWDATSSRLELVFLEGKAQWHLYGKPNADLPGDSPARQLLRHPIARMFVKGNDILEGRWKFRLPTIRKFSIKIRGGGELKDSWETKLGLQDPALADKKLWSNVTIEVKPSPDLKLEHDIVGTYQLLQDCGTAFNTMYKRTSRDLDRPPVFLFFDPSRIGNPNYDQYVFSIQNHRMEYQELRATIAQLHHCWRPSVIKNSEVQCETDGTWVPCEASLQPYQGQPASYAVPKATAVISISYQDRPADSMSPLVKKHCMNDPVALLDCKVPITSQVSRGWKFGPWTDIQKASERRTLDLFTWITERVRSLDNLTAEWRTLNLPESFEVCQVCTPDKPQIRWKLGKAIKVPRIVPYENGGQALDYERAMKARPAPWLIQTRVDHQRVGCFRVGLNLGTLSHRVLAKMPDTMNLKESSLSFRVVTDTEHEAKLALGAYILTDNKHTPEASHVFEAPETVNGVKQTVRLGELRKEQKRSLHWMMDQESDKAPTFSEQEVEEATLPQLGWRAEVRLRQERRVLGGVLADDVGYGKTLTTLALIDQGMNKANISAKESPDGYISLKATLIIVPRHLIPQWKDEIHKFLGKKYELIVIETMTSLNHKTVGDFQKADIIIVSWDIFKSPLYMSKMSLFAALPEGPPQGSRAFDTWLSQACDRVQSHTNGLKTMETGSSFASDLNARLIAAEDDQDLLREVPTRRLRGAKYVAEAEADAKNYQEDTGLQLPRFSSREADAFGIASSESYSDMTCPLFQMFCFHRLVIDEFTYVTDSLYAFIASLISPRRWILSGTPPLDDFADVKTIAGFIGVNLGEDDDAVGVLKGVNIKHLRKDRTAAEQFQAFEQAHSWAWHEGRHALAQSFIDQFIRKNTAEIEEIPAEERISVVVLQAVERIINMELAQQLQSQEMTIVRGGKGALDGDRERRIKSFLGGSKTSQEALLKRCSYFRLENGASSKGNLASTEVYDAVVCDRKKEKEDLIEELEMHLRHAQWLKKRCDPSPNLKAKDVHYTDWKAHVAGFVFEDEQATTELLGLIDDAENNYSVDHEELFYRDAPIEIADKKGKANTEPNIKPTPKTIDDDVNPEDDINEDAAREVEVDGASEELDEGKPMPSADTRPTKVPLDKPAKANTKRIKAPLDEPAKTDTRSIKIPLDEPAKAVFALRNLSSLLQALSQELVARDRSLRFLQAARQVQSLDKNLVCSRCNQRIIKRTDISVNVCCGHTACRQCLDTARDNDDEKCPVKVCGAIIEPYRMASANDLGQEDRKALCKYGSKLDKIIELIKSTPKDDQVLVFVQFEDLMKKIETAFVDVGIPAYSLTKEKRSLAGKWVKNFKEDTSADRKKVLVLNSADESAAGANLVNANHVVFVSPPLVSSQHRYNESLKQCIGRARRYGQTKTVYVHKFMAAKTIDVDIYEDQEGKKLICRGKTESRKQHGLFPPRTIEKNWIMVPEDEVADKDREVSWRSGFTSMEGHDNMDF